MNRITNCLKFKFNIFSKRGGGGFHMEPFHTFRSGKLNRNVGQRNPTKNENVVSCWYLKKKIILFLHSVSSIQFSFRNKLVKLSSVLWKVFRANPTYSRFLSVYVGSPCGGRKSGKLETSNYRTALTATVVCTILYCTRTWPKEKYSLFAVDTLNVQIYTAVLCPVQEG